MNNTDYEQVRRKAEKELAALKGDREPYETVWRDVHRHTRLEFRRERNMLTNRDYVRRGTDNDTGASTQLLDTHARMAGRVLRAGLHGGMTSPSRPWFKLGLSDPDLSDNPEVRAWFQPIEQAMRAIFRGSNIYSSLQQIYGTAGDYGTAAGMVVADFNDVVRFRALDIGEYWIASDHRGKPNTLYRACDMTVQQVIEEFGIDNVQERTRNCYDKGDYHQPVKVMRAIRPRRERDPSRMDAANMPFASLAWEENSPSDHMLRLSGVPENTLNVSRWETGGYEAYGVVSPGLDALADARQLQYYALRKAEAIDMSLRPPVQGPSGMFNSQKNFFPGGVTYVDDLQLQRGGFRPVFENAVRFDMAPMLNDIQEQRRRVDSAYYVDLFNMFSDLDRRQITAEEIIKRHEEKIISLGPVLDLQGQETLDPLIGRTFAVMMEGGLIDEPPDVIRGEEIKVEYISLLAQAQKAVGVGAIERTIGFAAQAAQIIDPGARHRIDVDEAIEMFADLVGTPPMVIRSKKDAEALRAAEEQKAQQAQMMDAAPGLAQAANLVSEANERGDRNLAASGVA